MYTDGKMLPPPPGLTVELHECLIHPAREISVVPMPDATDQSDYYKSLRDSDQSATFVHLLLGGVKRPYLAELLLQ